MGTGGDFGICPDTPRGAVSGPPNHAVSLRAAVAARPGNSVSRLVTRLGWPMSWRARRDSNPNLLIRRSLRGVRAVHCPPYPQVRVHQVSGRSVLVQRCPVSL